MFIDRIEKDPDLDDIIHVYDLSAARMSYHMGKDGVLRPGRIWRANTPAGGPESYQVTLFLPLPDGPPEVLKVEKHR